MSGNHTASSGFVRACEIFVAAHFFQSATGALEFKGQLFAGIQIRCGGGSTGYELDIAIIKLINEIHKPCGLIITGFRHLRDVG